MVYVLDYAADVIYRVLPSLPDAAHSTVTAGKSAVTADGSDSTTITVTLKNAKGNAWSGRQVSLTSSGSDTITPVNNGITDYNGKAVFTVKSTAVQTSIYTATDTTDNFSVTQTASVAFKPGPPSQLVWNAAPSGSGTAGEALAMQPAFYLEDQNGNVVTDDNSSTVTLTATGGFPLSGNSVTVHGGVAQFSDLRTTRAGIFTVTASCGNISSSASGNITIAQGPLSQLGWHCQPPAGGTQGL